MLGAIIGDIVGSRFERLNTKKKDFEFFSRRCFITDDSVMTFAIAKALLDSDSDNDEFGKNAVEAMQELGRRKRRTPINPGSSNFSLVEHQGLEPWTDRL